MSQKSQMSLDLLARQLPETSGIPKMASVGAPRSIASYGKLPRYLHHRVTETKGEDRNEREKEKERERKGEIVVNFYF